MVEERDANGILSQVEHNKDMEYESEKKANDTIADVSNHDKWPVELPLPSALESTVPPPPHTPLEQGALPPPVVPTSTKQTPLLRPEPTPPPSPSIPTLNQAPPSVRLEIVFTPIQKYLHLL